MPFIQDVLIIGASARAAAFSAVRAGLRPRCLDYFADADLAAVCPVIAIDPREADNELERVARSLDLLRWLYAGPFENRPDLIGRLSRDSHLLGNGAEALRVVRDPWNAASALTRHGLAAPRLARIADGPPSPGRWLVKPLASAGGVGVRFWDGEPVAPNRVETETEGSPSTRAGGDEGEQRPWRTGVLACPSPDSDRQECLSPGRSRNASQSQSKRDFNTLNYFQEFIGGPTLSALCVAAGGRARLLGIARQEQGAPGAPFLYRGSVGPWPVPESAAAKLERLGDILAAEFALVGLFGVDFILVDGEPWPIEINPRYTASVEVLELAARGSFLADHLRACVGGELPDRSSSFSSVVGKRVLYASRPIRFPAVPIPRFPGDVFQVPPIADIPRPGSVIPPGEPIMTVLAQGRNPAECLGGLDWLELAWRERLEANSDATIARSL